MPRSIPQSVATGALRAVLILAGLILAGPVLAEDKEPEDLAIFFGFDPLEIIKLDERSRNMRAADLDQDGLVDLVLVDNGHNRIDWLRQRAEANPAPDHAATHDVNAVSNSNRYEHIKIPVDREVLSLVTGDFNHDGRTDLAYVGNPDRLIVRFNSPDNPSDWTKQVEQRIPDFAPGSLILAAGDLNGDGRDDLAILGKERSFVVHQSDEGALLPAKTLMNTSSGLSLAQAADLDGDGRADLCYTATENNQSILCARLQTPAGDFGPELRFPLAKPRSVTLAELDRDPGRELLTIDSTTGRLAISKLRRPEESTGELAAQLVQYGFGDQSTRNARDLAIGDIDGDGRADVVVTDPASARMIVFRQHESTGLDLGQTFPGLVGAQHVRITDVDGDGANDVLVLSPEEGVVGICRFNEGRLTFPRPLPVGEKPIAMEIADVNGDGQTELVIIATGKASGKYDLRVFTFADGTTKPLKIQDKDALEIPLKGDPARINAFDANNDSRADLFIFLDRGRAPHVFLSNKEGGWSDQSAAGGINLGNASFGQVSVGTLRDPEADPDADDERSALLVAQGNFARNLDLDDKGAWRVVDQYNAEENGAKIEGTATLDLDGEPGHEIVLIDTGVKKLRILKADGNLYKRWKEVDTGSFPFLRAEVADLNNDKRDDLLLFGHGRFAVLYSGQTDPKLEEIASFESDLKKTFFIDSVAGDLNNDSYIDIAMFDTQSHYVEILDVDPRLGPRHATHFPIFEQKSFDNEGEGWGTEPREALIADVTGDQLPDLVLLVHDRVLVYPQQNPTTIEQPQTASKP